MRRIIFSTLAILMVGFIWLIPVYAQQTGKNPIKIGLICNFPNPSIGPGRFAAKLAVDEINAAGGILGRQIELVQRDDKGEVPLSVASYKSLILNDHVTMVMVPEHPTITFACQDAAANLYPEYPHLLFGGGSHPGLTEKVLKEYNKYKFFFVPEHTNSDRFNEVYTKPYVDEVVKREMGVKRIAVLLEDADWTSPSRKGGPTDVTMMFKEKGIEVTHYGVFAIGEKMFLPIFQKAADSKPDLIWFYTAICDTAIIAKQWVLSAARDIDLHLWWGSCQLPAFWDMTGGAALGSINMDPAFRTPITEKTIPFMDNLMKKYNVGPTGYCWAAYDMPYLFKAAVEKVGSIDNIEALIKELENIEIVGTRGRIKHGKDHRDLWDIPITR